MNAWKLLLPALILSLTAGTTLMLRSSDRAEVSNDGAPVGMVMVEGGVYTPLYATGSDEDYTEVETFYLDEVPVTNADYLEFVQENELWRRSNVPGIFADARYLRHWNGDLDFDEELANSPVVNVSWFAAQAYAEWKGKRLPTTSEWEFAASASETSRNGKEDEAYLRRIVDWYSRPSSSTSEVRSVYKNVYGAWDLHGLVWEWVDDYNESLVSGDSRDNVDMDLKLFCGSGAVDATDATDYSGFIRFAFRSGLEGSYTVSSLGFRLAKDIAAS